MNSLLSVKFKKKKKNVTKLKERSGTKVDEDLESKY